MLLYTGVSKSKAVVEGDTMWKRGTADVAEQNHRSYSCQLHAAMMRVWCKEILWPLEVPLRLLLSCFLLPIQIEPCLKAKSPRI